MTYNLTSQPWIPIRTPDGRHADISLLDLFEHPDDITLIDTADPFERFSLTRLLTAIRTAAIAANDGRAGQQWNQTVTAYLNERSDLFDIQNPERPFLQVAGMRPMSGNSQPTLNPLHPLLNRPLWKPGYGMKPLTPAKAARLLVTARNYDVAGVHTGMLGDPDARAGKAFAKGVPQAAGLFLCHLNGRNLKETLELNTPLAPIRGDKPIWDYAPETVGETPVEKTGPAIALTWPSRHIRLIWNDDLTACVGAYNTYGNRGWWDTPAAEPNAFWRFDDDGNPSPTHMIGSSAPVWRTPIWRNWKRLMTGGACPANLREQADSNTTVSFETLDIAWGPQRSSVDGYRNDRIIMDPRLLSQSELVQQWADDLMGKYDRQLHTQGAADAWSRMDARMRVWLRDGARSEDA